MHFRRAIFWLISFRAMWVMLYRFVRRKNGQSWVCQTNVRMSVSSQSTWKSETIEKWNRKTFFLFTGNRRKYRNKGLDVIHVDSVLCCSRLLWWHDTENSRNKRSEEEEEEGRDIPEKKKRNEILCSRLGKSPEGWVQVSGRYVCVFLFVFLPACLRRYVLPRYIARENEAWSWSVRSAANDNRPA